MQFGGAYARNVAPSARGRRRNHAVHDSCSTESVIVTLGKKMAGMRQLWSVARLSWLGRVEIGFVDLEHRLDLDGEIIGEVGAADDEAGMSAALAEDGDEKV